MCIPGLHLSLGIFNRLWELLEHECEELDLTLAYSIGTGSGGGGGTFTHYVDTLRQKSNLEMEVKNKNDHATLVDQLTTYMCLTLPNAETSDIVRQLRVEAATTHTKIADMVGMGRVPMVSVGFSLFLSLLRYQGWTLS